MHVYIEDIIRLYFGRAGQELKDVAVILKCTPGLVHVNVESQGGSILGVHIGIIVNRGDNPLDIIIYVTIEKQKADGLHRSPEQ